jgi:putative redox protein
MTVLMYARRQGWALRDVRISLHHDRKHAADCENYEDPNSRVDRIERIISLDGDLTAEQRRRLLAVAERCPVHRTLEHRPVVVDRLAEGTDELHQQGSHRV